MPNDLEQRVQSRTGGNKPETTPNKLSQENPPSLRTTNGIDRNSMILDSM